MILAALLLASAQCPSVQTAEASVCRALAAKQEGDFAASARAFETAAGLGKPGDPATDRMLAAAGNMWIAAGDAAKAAFALDRALSGGGLLGDQRGLALLDRARAAEAQNDLKTARAKTNEAAQTIGEDPFLWYFSAALAVRENDLATASGAINRALAMIPNDPDVLFEAGHIAQVSGDVAKARDYWQRAVAADPSSSGGAAAKKALDLLAQEPAPKP